MKIGIFHDYLTGRGGGERVTLSLAKNLNADVITTYYDPEKTFKEFEDVYVTRLTKAKKYPKGLFHIHLMNQFKKMDFQEYDFYIFSGTWCLFAAKKHHPNLWYCHTPVRFVYDLRERLLKQMGLPNKMAFRMFTNLLRKEDQKAVRDIDDIVANSENVKGRVLKYYGLDCNVINPPVDTSQFQCRSPENYYLTVNRIRPEKRIDLQVEAFTRMPNKKLKIVGGANNKTEKEYLRSLKSIATKNIEFVEQASDSELKELYSKCIAGIYTPIDEDFGLVPLEFNASGKPVIAVNEGGCRETVKQGVSGLLIEPTVDDLINAVNFMTPAKSEILKLACISNAKDYDEKAFIERIKVRINGGQ